MNLSFSFKISAYKKQLLWVAIILAAVPVGYQAFNNLPILHVGGNSYTMSDINEVADFTAQSIDITGAGKQPPKKAIFQSLVIAGVEKNILSKLNTQINRDLATRMVLEGNPLRGLLEKERKRIGEDRFYKIFVEPAATGEVFQQYYSNKDPQRQVANDTLSIAKSVGMAAAAQKAGVTPQEITFARNPQNEGLYAAVKEAGAGNIIPKTVEDGDNFYVIQAVEVTDQAARATAIILPRTSPGEFLANEIKSKNIPITESFYSFYRIKDLAEPGMIFAPKTVKNEGQKDDKK